MFQGKKLKIGIVGYGDFAKLMEVYLQEYFEILIFKRVDLELIENKVENSELIHKLKELDYIILAITLNGFENVCKKLENKLSKNTIIVDVASVKIVPIDLMKKYFNGYKILGTHPVFGPQSAKNGLENLPIVLTNISLSNLEYINIKKFLKQNLKLNIIEKTAEEHDREMAYIQGLSHFIGQALEIMNIQDYQTNTYSYKQLLKLKELLGKDSFELYKTIQNGNQYTENVRQEFLDKLNQLQISIKK